MTSRSNLMTSFLEWNTQRTKYDRCLNKWKNALCGNAAKHSRGGQQSHGPPDPPMDPRWDRSLPPPPPAPSCHRPWTAASLLPKTLLSARQPRGWPAHYLFEIKTYAPHWCHPNSNDRQKVLPLATKNRNMKCGFRGRSWYAKNITYELIETTTYLPHWCHLNWTIPFSL